MLGRGTPRPNIFFAHIILFLNFAQIFYIETSIKMDIPAKYDAAASESKWYKYWTDNNFIGSKPDGRKP